MAESCRLDAQHARNTHAKLLQALSSVGGNVVAEALGLSVATISRMKSEDLERFAAFLSVIGLKVVPRTHICCEPEYIKHLQYFARLGLERNDVGPPALDWADE